MIDVETPARFKTVAKECRLIWNIHGKARKSEQVKIKRKSFEMSKVSVFCQVEKKQMRTEY